MRFLDDLSHIVCDFSGKRKKKKKVRMPANGMSVLFWTQDENYLRIWFLRMAGSYMAVASLMFLG